MSNHVSVWLIMVVSFVLASAPIALGANILAKKLGESRWLWTILTLIPGVNLIFGIFAVFQLACHVIDSVKEIHADVASPDEATAPLA